MDFKQVGTLGTPIIIAAKNQLPELNGSYKGIFFKTTYDPSSEEDYPKGTILTVVENSDGTFSWSKPTILERLTNGITDGSQLLKDIEAFDGKGNKIVGTLESESGTGDIKNPYKARTYSEMNGYRTKDYANAYVEYTGQRQFTRDQIRDSSMYDKLYFDFPRQIGWVETFDWNNPDSNWTSDGLLYKCIVLFNVTPTKISDNTTEEAIPFSVYQMTTTGDSSDAQAGTVMYGIGFPSSFSWVSWGGTPDKEYSRTGYKLKITNVKREYYYLISDIISTTGEWSQIIDGTQFGYKHGTYKIDTNSNTIDNFQKLNLVLEDGGGGTARKTITNDYSYNLNSYYDYILKYSYEGKSSSVICKVGNFKFEGTQVTGANQLYNVTSDSDPDGIFFSLDPSCPLPYGWNAASIVDNFDLSNPKQSTPNKSVVGVSSNLYTLVGKTVTIEDISTAADMIYYTTLPSLSTPAAAIDIVKGKQAIDAEGNRISGTLEPVVLPALTNEGTAADLAQGKQLISSSGEIVTGTANLTNKLAQVIDRSITEITAEDLAGATSINYEAFSNCTNLASITIPNNIMSIGFEAFRNCRSLTSIMIPDSITSIGNYAFEKCSNLTNITIGNGVTQIGARAFTECSKLKNIYITDIAAWCNISGLTNLVNYISTNRNLYLNNELITSLVIPDSVTSISDSAFDGCCKSLTDVTISNSVTNIGNSAFSRCNNLVNITLLPITPPTLGSNVFNDIPASAVITVPKGSLNAYQTATNWSTYADKMVEATE